MPERVWRRELPGRNVGSVHVGGERIAFSYVDDQGKPGSPGPQMLVAFDFDGHEQWRVPRHRAELALESGGFLAVSDAGDLVELAADGRRRTDLRDGPSTLSGVRSVSRRGERIVISTESEAVLLNDGGVVVGRFPRPHRDNMDMTWSTFTGEGFAWIEGDELMVSDAKGEVRRLASALDEAAEGAMRRFEEETGIPALGGMLRLEIPAEDMNQLVEAMKKLPQGGKGFKVGERFGRCLWTLDVDADERVIFLSNLHPPHVIICVDFDGNTRWSKYLNSACCGGTPVPLPNGLYVASSGCGGILSWINLDGHVLYRSEPHGGVGLAGAYSNRLRVLSDSRCLIDGGPGLVAYGPDSRDLWIWPEGCSSFDISESRDLIVTGSWASRDGEPSKVAVQCLRGLDL